METYSSDFPLIIKEYESVIDSLTLQVDFYAKEHEKLKREIIALVAENANLSQNVSEMLDNRSNLLKLDERKDSFENELLENLKNQLGLTLKEKNTAIQLWQSALENIDRLEEELKLFEGRTHGYFSKAEVATFRQKYEKHITNLEEQLVTSRLKSEKALGEATKNLEKRSSQLQELQENQRDSRILTEQLKNEISKLQIINKDLQSTLNARNHFIKELEAKDVQARARVTEALQIVDAAVLEKEAALLRETEAKGEIVKLSQTLSEIIDEVAEKVKREIENVKQDCSLKLVKMQEDVEKSKGELNTKNTQLEKYVRECKLLEEELERIKKGNIFIDSKTSKLLILENKLESTYQKLLLSERKNLQVQAEKDNLKIDLEQVASCFKNDIQAREIEKQVLINEIKALRKQVKISKSIFTIVVEEINKLNSKIKLLDVDIREKLQEKDTQYQQAFAEALQAIESTNLKVQCELQEQLELHVNLNTKYKKEMQEIIDKFENRMQELKTVNKSLRDKLQQAVNKTLIHKNKLTKVS